MTAFRLARKDDGTLEVMNQTLKDGRKGKFFNVDFVLIDKFKHFRLNILNQKCAKDGESPTCESMLGMDYYR
jgi:hypothetical protein